MMDMVGEGKPWEKTAAALEKDQYCYSLVNVRTVQQCVMVE